MTALEENRYPDRLAHLVDTVIEITTAISDTADNHTKAWMMLFQGEATAYKAIWESHFGSMSAAIRLAFGGKRCYEDGLKYDSSLYDLYLGMGLYHYWKSVKAGPLRWFGIFRNDINRGIEEIYIAADSARLFDDLARTSLIYVWEHRGEFDSVITICREILVRFPEGSNPLWPMAHAYFQKRDYVASLQTYNDLRAYLVERAGNYRNLVECDYSIHECLSKLERDDEARDVARRFTGYYDDIPRETKVDLRGKIDYLRRAANR
jgi:tetratricopeptide (TPR) repeat protein